MECEGAMILTASRAYSGCRVSSRRSTRIFLVAGTFSAICCYPFRVVRHPEPPPRSWVPTGTHGPHQSGSQPCRGTGQGTMGHVNRENEEIREFISESVETDSTGLLQHPVSSRQREERRRVKEKTELPSFLSLSSFSSSS